MISASIVPGVEMMVGQGHFDPSIRRNTMGLPVMKHAHGHGHGHGHCTDEIPQTWVYTATWLIAALVMTLLKYVFCVVAAVMIHGNDPGLQRFLSIGIGVQLSSTFVTCLITSKWSKIGVNISGPDIIAAIFASSMGKLICAHVLDDTGSAITDAAACGAAGGYWVDDAGAGGESQNPAAEGRRFLAGAGEGGGSACYVFPQEQHMPTLLFLIWLNTFLMGAIWLAIAYKRWTHAVDYMPAPVVNGFLGCIGWKVLKYSVKVGLGSPRYKQPEKGIFWKLLAPVVVIGIPLYFMKKHHIGNPLVVLPCFLFVPVVIFYVVAFASGSEMAGLREEGWLFDEVPSDDFHMLFSELKFAHISGGAIGKCVPDLIICLVILVIDSFLKLGATKTKLGIDVDMAHELLVTGWENVVACFCMGSPGYPQVKFNVLSHGILHNTKERRVGYFMAVACGLMFFGSWHIINYLPRLLLGGLLLYASCPFLVDNLYATWFHVTRSEFAAIWLIVVVMAVVSEFSSAGLLVAVLLGVVVAVVIFAFQYARVSIIREVLSGHDYHSKVTRTFWEEALVTRVGVRMGIVVLEGFIFFASAGQIMKTYKDLKEASDDRPKCEQLRYVIFDFEHVNNVDFSGVRTFFDLKRVLKADKLCVVFTGLSQKIRDKFVMEGVMEAEDHWVQDFEDLDRGSEYIERLILKRAAKLRANWLLFDSFMKIHTEAQLKLKFEMFEAVLGSEIGHELWKYAKYKDVKKGEFLCREGEVNATLYLLQRGQVTAYSAQGTGEKSVVTRIRTIGQGAVINDECLFMDLPVAFSCVADEDSAIWELTRAKLKMMSALDTDLALSIHQVILRYASTTRHRLEREIHALEHPSANLDKKTKKGKRSKRRKKPHHDRKKAMPEKKRRESTLMRMKSMHLATTVMDQIRQAHEAYEEQLHATSGAADTTGRIHRAHSTASIGSIDSEGTAASGNIGDHHHHHFQHIHVVPDSPLTRANSAEIERLCEGASLHLSVPQEENARKWFDFHAKDVASRSMADLTELPMAELKVTTSALVEEDEDEDDDEEGEEDGGGGDGDGNGRSSPTAREKRASLHRARTGRYLGLMDLQKAMMDLGLFPNINEIKKMHATLRPHKRGMRSCGREVKMFDQVDLEEFLKMVEVMTLAQLTKVQIAHLHKMFDAHSERDSHSATGMALHRDGLAALMAELGHPEDEVELEFIMQEWDVNNRGYLDFDAFLSVVATFLKREELDEAVERDFLRLCGHDPAESDASWPAFDPAMGITIDALHKSLVEHWPDKWKDARESRDVAEEMVFDADIEQTHRRVVTLDELITCLEMVGMKEVEDLDKQQGKDAKVAWRRPSGCHISRGDLQSILKELHDEEGGPAKANGAPEAGNGAPGLDDGAEAPAEP